MFNFFRQYEPNPVLLYELRQAVRNRFVVGLMMLYLLLTTLIFYVLLSSGDSVNFIDRYIDQYLGISFDNNTTRLAASILVFTTVTLVVFAAIHTASDRLEESPVLYTLLPPWWITSGKMQFGFVIGLLFLSIMLPFLSVAYLMRGFDVRIVLTGSLFYFCWIQIQYFLTVTFFAGAKSYARIIALILPLLLLQLLLGFFGIFSIHWILSNAIQTQWKFLSVLMAILSFFLLAMIPLFLLTTVQFAPKTSNRMFLIRVLSLSIQLFLIVLFMLSRKFFGDETFIFAIDLYCFHFVVPYLFLFCICEREEISPRIRQTIPLSTRNRLLALPFYTGAANAMVWCVLTLSLEGVFFLIEYLAMDHKSIIDLTIPCCGGAFNFGLLLFDYCATTLFIYHLNSRRRISKSWNWIFPFAFVAVAILFPLFEMILSNLLPGSTILDLHSTEIPFLPYPYLACSNDFAFLQMKIGLVWFAVLALISLPWLYRHFNDFRRNPIDNIVPDDVSR